LLGVDDSQSTKEKFAAMNMMPFEQKANNKIKDNGNIWIPHLPWKET